MDYVQRSNCTFLTNLRKFFFFFLAKTFANQNVLTYGDCRCICYAHHIQQLARMFRTFFRTLLNCFIETIPISVSLAQVVRMR
ncbi:hypothetical protein UP06_31085 [Bradyrhizobium sp. LTSP857]|nr:hypothetical protein UP06_31085 [Bradyrhizobium sp. LTSP857]